jgi:hypothetical protein
MDRAELKRIGAALRRQYDLAKQAPLTPSMLALLVQLRESEDVSRKTSRRGNRTNRVLPAASKS